MKRQLDTAIENLQQQKAALEAEFKGKVAGLDAAIVALRNQKLGQPTRRKKAPKPADDAQPWSAKP